MTHMIDQTFIKILKITNIEIIKQNIILSIYVTYT